VFGNEVEGGVEERGKRAGVFKDGHIEAIHEFECGEKEEGVVGNFAEEVDLACIRYQF
jgi:hypothetical protein